MLAITVPLITTVVLAASARPVAGQELEPRAYSASPVGATFLVVAINRSTGSVLTDASLPVRDVHVRLVTGAVGIGHTFDLFTRTALITAVVPYTRATATGQVQETSREVMRIGWADARAKFSVNLLGGRALRLAEFVKAPRVTIIGVSLSMVFPTGQYYSDKLINLGSNRWSFKPEAGISVPVQKWTLESYVGVWLFSDNSEFFPGNALRTQAPVWALQGHVSYTVRPRLWLAFDATWYSGGTTTVDGFGQADLQRNSRLGATVSIPVGQRQSVKATYSAGATTRFGGDFNTISLAWQYSWIR